MKNNVYIYYEKDVVSLIKALLSETKDLTKALLKKSLNIWSENQF